jgi:hypothetical protein
VRRIGAELTASEVPAIAGGIGGWLELRPPFQGGPRTPHAPTQTRFCKGVGKLP